MLIQIDEDEWVESLEIEYIAPQTMVWDDDGVAHFNFLDRYPIESYPRYTGLKVRMRSGKVYYGPIHPQIFRRHLGAAGAVAVDIPKGDFHHAD